MAELLEKVETSREVVGLGHILEPGEGPISFLGSAQSTRVQLFMVHILGGWMAEEGETTSFEPHQAD